MDEEWKRWMAAIALSLVLPQTIVQLGSKQPTQSVPAESSPGTAATDLIITTAPVQAKPVYILVLTPMGTVMQMELEEYVRGVVLAEMPAYFDEEALKAQAIAARTYALRRLTLADRHPAGAICSESTCCQAWMSDEDYLADRGTREDWAKIAAAVNQTCSMVLTYDGALAETTYFSCSGGRTEDALAVWGEEIPYLQSVDSPGEEQASGYEQQLYFTKNQFAAALGRTLAGSPDDWLGEVRHTPGGSVDTMVIAGITYSGVELRKLLELNSTLFTVSADDSGITVTTWGKGHRVGLSQYGADAMAVSGSTFEEILSHYYRGTRIDKFTDVE